MISEYSDNTITDEELTLDGKEKTFKAPFGNTPGTISAHLSPNGDTLFIDSKIKFNYNGRSNEWTTSESWTLEKEGQILSVQQTFNSFQGKRTLTAVYNKE